MSILDAAYLGDLSSVKRICDEGNEDVDKKNFWGETALMVALIRRYYNIVQELCERGADLNAQARDGMSVLHLAVLCRDVRIVKYFCERGADIEIKDNKGRTPLVTAVRHLELYTVKYLCTRGAKVDVFRPNHEKIQEILTKQEFRWNVGMLLNEGVLTTDLLRVVHSWI